MEAGAYAVQATSEASHWRFAGLRRLFARELARLAKMRSRSISDLPLVGQPKRVGLAPLRRYHFNWLVRS
jgi:hypothetical protein